MRTNIYTVKFIVRYKHNSAHRYMRETIYHYDCKMQAENFFSDSRKQLRESDAYENVLLVLLDDANHITKKWNRYVADRDGNYKEVGSK